MKKNKEQKQDKSENTAQMDQEAVTEEAVENEGEIQEENESNNDGESKASDKDDLSEMKDKYLRLYSEFDNFRRRTAKEKLEVIQTANADLLVELLPTLDDFERAMDNSEGADEGLEIVYKKFKKTLEGVGLKEIKAGPGTEFDVEIHEAISQIPAPEKKLKGKIVDVVERGYFLKDKVIRFAKVVVGS